MTASAPAVAKPASGGKTVLTRAALKPAAKATGTSRLARVTATAKKRSPAAQKRHLRKLRDRSRKRTLAAKKAAKKQKKSKKGKKGKR